MLNHNDVAYISEDIKSKLLSGDKEMMKTAGLAASEYFRVELRENGIRRQITPPVTVTKENFDNAIYASQNILSLPINPYLSINELRYITQSIGDFYG